MRRLAAVMLGMALALGAGDKALAAPPHSVEIKYDLLRNGASIGTTTVRLTWRGAEYRIEEQVRGRGFLAALGEARRSSRGTVTRGGLRPLEFEDRRTGHPATRVQFDWNAKLMTMEHGEGKRTEALPSGAQDQLSLLFNFSFRRPASESIVVHVADGRRINSNAYSTVRERLRTPAGEFDALKFVKKRERPQDKATELWLTADRQGLPVRILVIDKDGAQYDQVATRIALK